MKKILLSLVAGILATSMIAPALSPAMAIEGTTQQTVEDRCAVVTARVDLILNRYQQKKENHLQKYNRIQTKLQNLITLLKSKGYDTTKLEADLLELKAKVAVFQKAIEDAMQHLRNSKTYACGHSGGSFKNEIYSAKQDILKARETALSIRIFIFDTIKPDIKALRNQITASKAQ